MNEKLLWAKIWCMGIVNRILPLFGRLLVVVIDWDTYRIDRWILMKRYDESGTKDD